MNDEVPILCTRESIVPRSMAEKNPGMLERMNQTKQFGTFDTLGDRKELVILFEKLGEGLPEPQAMKVRAKFLESLIPLSVGTLSGAPWQVTPCSATEAYLLFVQITGVLEVPIATAAKILDATVKKKAWLKETWLEHDRRTLILGS